MQLDKWILSSVSTGRIYYQQFALTKYVSCSAIVLLSNNLKLIRQLLCGVQNQWRSQGQEYRGHAPAFNFQHCELKKSNIIAVCK